MGMTSVTMVNIKEGVDALDMMEQCRVGAREENQVSLVNMDEGCTDEQQQLEMPIGKTQHSNNKWNATLRAVPRMKCMQNMSHTWHALQL
jgi:hypothetical protein